jgi:hypothetical protein
MYGLYSVAVSRYCGTAVLFVRLTKNIKSKQINIKSSTAQNDTSINLRYRRDGILGFTPYRITSLYQCFVGLWCLHPHGEAYSYTKYSHPEDGRCNSLRSVLNTQSFALHSPWKYKNQCRPFVAHARTELPRLLRTILNTKMAFK